LNALRSGSPTTELYLRTALQNITRAESRIAPASAWVVIETPCALTGRKGLVPFGREMSSPLDAISAGRRVAGRPVLRAQPPE
jgi:hypothetical protein